MNSRHSVLVIIAVAALVRLVLAQLTGLGVDESYMVSHARAFSWSYVDHPPLHVWLVGAWAKLIGSEHSGLLRLPFIALFAGTTWLLYRLTSRLFSDGAGLWAVIALNLAPLFGLAAGSWILPDGPVDFFMLACANVVADLVVLRTVRRPLLAWIFAGVLGGLALLSKYHGVFVFAGTFLYLLSVRDARHYLATPGPWLGALVALAVFSPVILWNLDHGMVGLAFQSRRLDHAQINVGRLLGSIAAQSVYLAIWTFVPAVIGLWRALRDGPRAPASWFLAMIAIGPILFFTLATLWAPGLPHWTAAGWLFAMPLAGRVLAGWEQRWPMGIWRGTVVAIALLGLLIAGILAQLATGWLNRLAPEPMRRGDISRDILNWSDLRAELTQRGLLAPGTLVASEHWISCGKISYALGPAVTLLCLSDWPQHFAFRYDLRDYAGRDVVIVTRRMYSPQNLAYLESHFGSVERLAPIEVKRINGDTFATFDVAIGRGLRPVP